MVFIDLNEIIVGIVFVMKIFDNYDWDLVFSFCYYNYILYC